MIKQKNGLILKIEGTSKTFGPTKAVVNANLEIFKGEIRGLIGENGSGKSTLASIIAGAQKPDCGKMFFNNKAYNPLNIIDARKKGISLIVQEVGTINNLNVAENMFLGKEDHFSKLGHVNKSKMIAASKEILNRIGASHIDPQKSINMYSFEDRKLIEVAMAMYDNPDLLILDETTTALARQGRKIIYNLIKDMEKRRNTVIFISHDLLELESICSSITVLRDGEIVKTLSKNEINGNIMRQLMIGRDLAGHYYRTDFKPTYSEEVVLSVKGLLLRKKVRKIGNDISLGSEFKNISFELHKGEILGIGGLAECGMHDLCKVLFGIIKPDSGEVKVMPQNKKIKKASDALQSKIGYLPKDREREGLMQGANIRDNIVLMSFDKLKKGPFITRKSEKSLAKKLADVLSIKMVSLNQPCMYLSGGNKQKVSIAKWLANDSKILIMDCPTRGIDIGVKEAIYDLMNEIKKAGSSIIMVSEELPELLGMADRILVLKNGQISGRFLRSADLSEASIIKKMI